MTKRHKFRPAVNGLEERLALNGTLNAAAALGHAVGAAADVKHTGGHTTHGHTTHGHTTHSHTHKGHK